MSEIQPPDEAPVVYRQDLKLRMGQEMDLLNLAAEVIGGKGTVVPEVFELPTMGRREDAPMPEWTADQEKEIRSIISVLGFGAEETVHSPLLGGIQWTEGGTPWKMLAEVRAFLEKRQAATLLIAGASFRSGSGVRQDERAYIEKQFGVPLPDYGSEHDVAKLIAKKILREDEGGAAVIYDEPESLRGGYDITDGNPFIRHDTGQLAQIGTLSDGIAVQTLRIDQDLITKEDGSTAPHNRLRGDRVFTWLSELIVMRGYRRGIEPVVLNTSSTYAARRMDTILAGLRTGQYYDATLYGRSVLKAIDAPVPKEMPLNHIPGEIRDSYDKRQAILDELNSKQEHDNS